MGKKPIYLLIILFCFILALPSCIKNNQAKGTNNAATGTTAANTNSSTVSNTRKIIFNTTIEDPQIAYMNSLGEGGFKGQAGINLALYETSDGVFEGYGWITRTWNQSVDDIKMQQKYSYRMGLVSIKPGSTVNISMIGRIREDRDIPTLLNDGPVSFASQKEGSSILKEIPISLELNSNEAVLSVKFHEKAELQFPGKIEKGPVESHIRSTSVKNGLMYINSQWSDSLSGGGEDYTAILLAAPVSGSSKYSGSLFLTGNGDKLAKTDAKVSIDISQFDSNAYKNAGGKYTGEFTGMSIFEAGGKKYALLVDGDEVILEPLGTGTAFFGDLFAADKNSYLLNQANKTKTMISCLYRQTGGGSVDYSAYEGLDPKDPEDMKKILELAKNMSSTIGSNRAIPAWYPKNLIPVVNFSGDDGYITTPCPNALFFKLYTTEYCENEDFTDLVAPYRRVLSKYDDYKEYINKDTYEGIFVFTMGRYTIQVFLQQSSMKATSVGVTIY